jgi:hypothetical protein
MNSAGTDDPLACAVGAIPVEERQAHRELTEHLFGRVLMDHEELANGYGFLFPMDSLPEVAAFVRNERKCCPFLRFEIDMVPHAASLRLRLTGPAGTAHFLEGELAL